MNERMYGTRGDRARTLSSDGGCVYAMTPSPPAADRSDFARLPERIAVLIE
ncbi:hypothetical protein AArcCO_2690 [Halalkaliarchaeum sp. AArc-CO]|nr:hypothetical protein AArcCO_2690 [Halalkaliarchaeum sp. AArc-CO]